MIKNEEAPRLLRKLNLLDSTLLVIGGVIGSGIFMTTGIIAGHLPSPGLIFIAWIVGGFMTLCGALSFAELGAMFPKAGGQYVYLREAYGNWAGFLYGWGFFWVIECGGVATLAVAFAEYFGYFFPSLSTKAFLIQFSIFGFNYSLSAGQLIAVASITIISAVNYYGIKNGILIQNMFTFLRIGAIVLLVVFGLALGKKAGVTNFNQFFEMGGGFNFKMFGLALIAVFWTFDGWYSVSCTAEEVKNPGRNIPLGLIMGTLSVTFIYLAMNVIYIIALPIEQMSGVVKVGELASEQLFGDNGTFLISGIISIAIFGCLVSSILYGPRVYLAMAKDNSFFKSMKYIHPRYRVPSKGIFWQALWASLLCLTGTFQALLEYVVFALVLFFAAAGLSVIVLRFRQPNTERPYRAWGYPILPVIFILINLAVFFNTIWAQPYKSLIGLMILVVGIPAFIYWKRKSKVE